MGIGWMFLIFYFGQAGIEYKVLKTWPSLQPHFHGVKGMVISGLISAAVTVAIGTTMGVAGGTAAALAGLLGLFTNSFTFKLFSILDLIFTKARAAKETYSE